MNFEVFDKSDLLAFQEEAKENWGLGPAVPMPSLKKVTMPVRMGVCPRDAGYF